MKRRESRCRVRKSFTLSQFEAQGKSALPLKVENWICSSCRQNKKPFYLNALRIYLAAIDASSAEGSSSIGRCGIATSPRPIATVCGSPSAFRWIMTIGLFCRWIAWRSAASQETGIRQEIGLRPSHRPRHPSGWLRIVSASCSFAPANPADSADAGKSVAIFLATLLLLPSIITELDRFTVLDWLLVRLAIHDMLPSFESVAGVCLAWHAPVPTDGVAS